MHELINILRRAVEMKTALQQYHNTLWLHHGHAYQQTKEDKL